MSYNQFDVPASTVAIVAATAKTVLGIKASTNVCVKLLEVATSFDGATSSNAPVVCEFMQSTFATNAPGTNSSSVTPGKRDAGRAETIQATAGKTWTTEPTVLALQWAIDVGQFNGLYHYIHPFASPFIIIGAQGAVLRLTSPNNVNATNKFTAEE